MRRRSGARTAVLGAVTALLVATGVATGVAAVPALAAPAPAPNATSTAPRSTASPTPTATATGTTTGTATGTPTGTAGATPSPTPTTKGIPATFTGRLDQLRAQAATLRTDLTAKQAASATAIATYTATTKQVQQALANAATAQQQLTEAGVELDAARTQVQVLARDTYVEHLPGPSSAVLLTTDVGDLDFTVAALGYLSDRSVDIYDRFTQAKANAQTYASTQQSELARAKALQTRADGQRAAALTALAAAQTQQGAFLAAVTALRNDAAKAAGAGPLSAADTAAYQAFLAQLNALGAGVTTGPPGTGGTTYVAGGPGLTPMPGTSWVKPLLKYTISSCYCIRWGTFHHGVDLAAPLGTPIYAVGAGTVVAAGPAQGFGNWVVIDHHDGSFSIYGHMRVLATVVGAQTTPGMLIAYVGSEGESTGAHLHFEVRIGSYASAANSTDPVLWLAQRGVTL